MQSLYQQKGISMKRTLAGLMSLMFLVSGCATAMNGGGEVGVGYSSTTRVFLYHTVDGDKEGKEAGAEINADPLLRNYKEYKETSDSDDE